MKWISMTTVASAQEVAMLLADNNRMNERIRYEEGELRPRMHVRYRAPRLRVRCEMTGGPTKDNGYLQSTFFWGTLREKGGKTHLRGVIVTEPIFHLLWLAMMIYFVVQCVTLGGISVVPICLSAFLFFMLAKEYKKQNRIRIYLTVAFRRLEQSARERGTEETDG